jgi:hypothetical protein
MCLIRAVSMRRGDAGIDARGGVLNKRYRNDAVPAGSTEREEMQAIPPPKEEITPPDAATGVALPVPDHLPAHELNFVVAVRFEIR